MIALDQQEKVGSVSIRSSGDTTDHVDAIVEEKTFFEQFIGKTESELVRIKNIEAVSGATLTSLAIADAIALRFGVLLRLVGSQKPIQIDEVKTYFPDCEHVQPSKTHPSLFDVSNSTGQFLGKVGRTSRNQTKLLVTKDRSIRFSQLALMGNLSGWKFEIVSRISLLGIS